MIDYCPITTSIIDSLSSYESVKYWEPTLVYNNGCFYIAALNEVLYDTIKDIPLTNDLKMVADYVQYGINISESVIEYFSTIEDPLKVNLAVNFQSDFEIKELETAIKWLRELGCDGISESSRISSNFKQLFLLGENSENLLNELEIDIIRDQSNLKSYEKPVMIHYRNYGVMDLPTTLFKTIKCVNSEPVNLGIK